MHNLNIVVRLGKKDGDLMDRHIVPSAHDKVKLGSNCCAVSLFCFIMAAFYPSSAYGVVKGFFVSSRVGRMVDFHLARNLDWEVTKEPVSLGGFEKLKAGCIVRRKPGYFVRNYLIIVWLLSTSAFTAFNARPDDFNSRVVIVFTVILAVVAFKYSGSEEIPVVSYPTILDSYVLANFYTALGLGTVTFMFTTQCTMGGVMSQNNVRVMKDVLCSRMPGRWYGMDWIPPYSPQVETGVGLWLGFAWIYWNYQHWSKMKARIEFNLKVVDEVGIGWMNYKAKKGVVKGRYMSEHLIDGETRRSSAHSFFQALLSPFRAAKMKG